MRSRRYNRDRDYEQRVLDIARVTRVVSGGKRLSFRALVAIAKKDGSSIGVGLAKGQDVSQAIDKAVKQAKKNAIKLDLVNQGTIPHEVHTKYKAAEIIFKPAKEGKGIIAGGVVRTILSLTPIANISAKILGKTSNPINNARAVIKALSYFHAEPQPEKPKIESGK